MRSATATLAYEVVDVFTDRPFAGNPLAVVLDADGLPDAALQQLAAEVVLSGGAPSCGPALDPAPLLAAVGLRPQDVAGVARQGEQVGRPSLLRCTVTVRDGRAVATTVAGSVVPVARGEVRRPD